MDMKNKKKPNMIRNDYYLSHLTRKYKIRDKTEFFVLFSEHIAL